MLTTVFSDERNSHGNVSVASRGLSGFELSVYAKDQRSMECGVDAFKMEALHREGRTENKGGLEDGIATYDSGHERKSYTM